MYLTVYLIYIYILLNFHCHMFFSDHSLGNFSVFKDSVIRFDLSGYLKIIPHLQVLNLIEFAKSFLSYKAT